MQEHDERSLFSFLNLLSPHFSRSTFSEKTHELKIHLAIEFMIATQFQVNVHTFENRMIHFAFFQFGMQVICVKSIVRESVYQIWALAMILID